MISIVIPTYNEEEAIGEDIETSPRDHGAPPDYEWELIVVNDGSTDRTREIVEGYADRGVRLVNHPYNLGGGASPQHRDHARQGGHSGGGGRRRHLPPRPISPS